jgi:protein-tyrosine-phosphatase
VAFTSQHQIGASVDPLPASSYHQGVKDGLFQILFVCTGNICRSPMGEGILRARLSARAAEFASVGSAGVSAFPGQRASSHSIAVARDHGIDLSSHRSRPLTPLLIRTSDLILAMEAHHRDAIVHMVPDAAAKTFVLTDYVDGTGSATGVPDPIGHEIGTYREVFTLLDREITQALPRIEAMIAAAEKNV